MRLSCEPCHPFDDAREAFAWERRDALERASVINSEAVCGNTVKYVGLADEWHLVIVKRLAIKD